MTDLLQDTWDSLLLRASDSCGGSMILLAQSGSRSYGTHRPDSDHDFRGVFVVPAAKMLSLEGAPETLRLDEVDGVAWELRHFCKLAANANPTALEVLWADAFLQSLRGEMLREARYLFLSKRVAKTYGGYALAQVKKAQAGSGGSRGVEHFKREKFKLHTLRLLYSGRHALEHGEVLVRLDETLIARLRAESKLPMDEFVERVRAEARRLDEAATHSLLPDAPNPEAVNRLMRELRGLLGA